MSTATAAIICSIVGGLFELAGLATVVRGIWEDRRQARRLFEPRAPKPVKTPPRWAKASASQLEAGHTMRGLRSPTVGSIAKRQYESEAAIANALGRVTDHFNDELARIVVKLREEMAESDGDLREKIRYMLSESVSGRRLGVILLAVGIVFAMAGTLLAAAS